ncbi:oxidoreductase, partial [mine drainage metagenome]
RSALRLSSGGPVTLVYRRGREEMPADPDEIREAEAEGIEFLFYRAPVRIEGSDRVSGLTVRTVNLGPPDPNGRRELVAVDGPETTLPCDTIIVAVGQIADLKGWDAGLDLQVNARGWPEGRGPGFATAVEGVFAAGGRSVVYAMGSAMEAAQAIDEYLSRRRGEPPYPARPDPLGGTEPFHLAPGYTAPIRAP